MRRRRRTLIGAIAMVAFVIAYALIVMSLVQAPALQRLSGAAQFLIYAVLGLCWILPLLPLIKWMERPDST